DVLAKPVLHEVEGGEVAALPPEELEEVEHRDGDGDEHRVAHVPGGVELGLLGGEGADDHAPAHHAQAAVDQLLQVDAEEGGVELDTPVVVPDEVARDAAVLRRRPVAALPVETQTEDEREDHERRQDLPEMVPHDPGVEEPEAVGAAEEQGMGDEPRWDSVELVPGAVAGRRDRTLEGSPRKPGEEDQLDDGKHENDRCARRAGPGPVRSDGPPARSADQREERAVEGLEAADDPEDDRRGGGREDEEQWAYGRPDEVDGSAPAWGGPGSESLGRPGSWHGGFPASYCRAGAVCRSTLGSPSTRVSASRRGRKGR